VLREAITLAKRRMMEASQQQQAAAPELQR
jgi:hypothetical protein